MKSHHSGEKVKKKKTFCYIIQKRLKQKNFHNYLEVSKMSPTTFFNTLSSGFGYVLFINRLLNIKKNPLRFSDKFHVLKIRLNNVIFQNSMNILISENSERIQMTERDNQRTPIVVTL